MVSYAIIHAAFRPERKATLERMCNALERDVRILSNDEPEHSSSWGYRAFKWASEQPGHACILEDDVHMIPRFADTLEAVVQAVPDQVLSLHAQGKDARRLAQAGHRHLRFYDLTTPASVFPPGAAADLLSFWDKYASELKYKKDLNHDNVACQWAWDRQRPMWATLPALVVHDTSVPSTLGYDWHTDRVTTVGWQEPWWPDGMLEHLTSPSYWEVPKGALVPLIENPWFSSRHMDLLRKQRRGLLPPMRVCSFCEKAPGVFASASTAATVCLGCARNLVLAFERARNQ